MTREIDIPDELKEIGPDRIETWREWGVAAVEAELIHGGTGVGLRSGSAEVQQMAWRWIRWEKEHATVPKLTDAVILKPTLFGVGVDLKKGWDWMKDALAAKKGQQ
jgi:hypothetical protein